jgi:hypothetical protein
MTSSTRTLLARGLLAASLGVLTLTASMTAPAAADASAIGGTVLAAQPEPEPEPPLETEAATIDQKIAVAIKFGRGDDSALTELGDRDFVIALWKHIKDNADYLEVRTAAEQAYTTSSAACYEFIVTDVFAAFDRDIAREQRETEAKRQSDLARATATTSIGIVAGPELLDTTDLNFIRLIWEITDEDGNWPKVKAAARDARNGTPEQQREFIASGMAAAAKQDTDDRIAADGAQTEAEKAAARARAAKQSAANRIGLPVTEVLLSLPDRDFVVEVWNHEADDTQVQIAAITAARSLEATAWKAFIDTGIHEAKDRDIQIALDRQAAEDRRLVEEILARADKAGQFNLPQAARKALAGTPQDVADFLHVGQYQVAPDLPDALRGGARFGPLTGLVGKCLDVASSGTADGTTVQLYTCNSSAAQAVTSPGDGTLRLFGKCVDANGPATGTAGDRLVYLWKCNGTAAQKWRQRPNGTIYHAGHDRCLDVPKSDDRTQLYVHACNLGANQKWTVTPAAGARFGRVTGLAGKCIDIDNSGYANGTAVQMYTCNNTAAQSFTLPGDLTMRVLGRCVDAGGPAKGTAGDRLVHLWACNGTAAQTWEPRTNGTLYNAVTNRCLDAPKSDDRTQLYVHTCNTGANQKWTLPKAG